MNLLHIDPIAALFVSAVINGIAAPPLLYLIIRTGAHEPTMGQQRSGPLSRTLTWIGFAAMILGVVALVGTVRGGSSAWAAVRAWL